MDKERLKRYKEKLDLIGERIKYIKDWTSGMEPEFFGEDKKTMLAVYKSFQEIIEASSDICVMILKDENKLVKDDYDNIKKLQEMNLISEKIAGFLREGNGLRNRLVHEYNGLESETAFLSINELLPKAEKFIEEVKKWIK